MKKVNYFLISFMNALGVLIYLLALTGLFALADRFFPEQDSFLMPVMMLLLFIISASITGFLVLGKPVLLYLDNLKREAVILLFSTIGWLVFFLLLTFVVLLLI